MQLALVIGADGTVGSAVASRLEAAGWSVERSTSYPADAVIRPGSVVFHFAGNPNYQQSAESASADLMLTTAILASAKENGARAVVVASSDWVSMRPDLPYAQAKARVEALASAYTISGFPVIVDRIGYCTGKDDLPDTALRRALFITPGALFERIMSKLEYALGVNS